MPHSRLAGLAPFRLSAGARVSRTETARTTVPDAWPDGSTAEYAST